MNATTAKFCCILGFVVLAASGCKKRSMTTPVATPAPVPGRSEPQSENNVSPENHPEEKAGPAPGAQGESGASASSSAAASVETSGASHLAQSSGRPKPAAGASSSPKPQPSASNIPASSELAKPLFVVVTATNGKLILRPDALEARTPSKFRLVILNQTSFVISCRIFQGVLPGNEMTGKTLAGKTPIASLDSIPKGAMPLMEARLEGGHEYSVVISGKDSGQMARAKLSVSSSK